MSVPDQLEDSKHPSRTARRVRRFLGRSWQALVVAAVVLSLGVLAFLSPGLVRADVRLDEGTVQVAKQDTGGLGVLNAQIDELAGYTTVGDSQFRILQDGRLVLVHGTESSTLMAYSPARNRLESPVQLPSSATVELGGGTLLVVNPDNGKVWFGAAKDVLAFDFQKEKAQLEVGEFGTATVTSAGEVIGLDIQRSVLVRPGTEESRETPLPFTIDADAINPQLSAVGGNAVVLDDQSGRIWVEGMGQPFEVSGASGAKLVAPAPDALGGKDGAKAIYATKAGLIALTNDGPRSLTGNLDAKPIQPVQLGDCVYAAFDEKFVRACAGEEPEIRDIPDVPEGHDLVFQVNRSTVVLNDVASGVVWMVNKDMLRIEDWDRVIPPDSEDEDEVSETVTVIPPDRGEDNKPPIAKDDDLAARAGRSTILDVLDNDTDPDGDVLTISTNTELSGASLQTVRGGTGLQITVDSDATGTLTFPYEISDGRRGSATANVIVRILPDDPAAHNGAPYKHSRAMPLDISLGQTIRKRVLLDWRDPDGDSLILVEASLPPDAEDEVSFTPDGEVTFRDIGKTTGTKKVLVKVSDGHDVIDDEMLIVVKDDVVPPIAYGDFETTPAGKSVAVYPLANDIGANLTLTEVGADEDCECEITTNYREKSFTFSADEPDVYYVTYKVSNGPVATGLVRIDVRAESKNHPPVAAVDVALLPPGGSVMIDPVLNDTDEDGDVLVVQSVSQASGLQVVLERRHLVTITDLHTPTEPVTLTYRLSDGKFSVLGSIIVIPTTAGSFEPQAAPDEVRIRAGATQSVDVLDNDTSPIGLDLTLDSLVENPLGDRAWIDGNRLRVAVPAGAQASSMTIIYEIRDSEDRVASSRARITVVSEDAQNEPPMPQPVVERVLADTTTRLIIPMDGIDPNGDAVRLVGLGSGPSLGRVMDVGDGWLSYEAFPDSKGTDVFTYQVVDSLGAIGLGEIRVGVAPAGPENTAPTGVTDEITVRPGRQVQIPALRNDVDIDGDAITYVASDPVEIDDVDDVEVIEKRDISFVAPDEPGTYIGTYWIEDARGLQGSGELQITVEEDAPLLPPEARDDVVPVPAVAGKDWVEVDVTTNDLDPDGRPEDLRVEVPDYGAPEDHTATATDGGRRITVPVLERMQQLRYEVVDADGLRATGLVLVPGRNDSVPVLKDPEVALEATAGQSMSIDINSHVAGTLGRTVRLAGADSVSAPHGNALPGAARIDYTPEVSYEGPDSVVFEVIDEVKEGDKTARSAYISIPVKVAPAPNRPKPGEDESIAQANTPPELIGGGDPVLKVGPGEGDARLDLLPLFRDADGDSFFFEDFTPVSGDKSIEWKTSSDKSKLFAHTPTGTQPGSERILSAVAVDANGGRSPRFQIRLEVTTSNRPLPTTVADVAETLAGQEVPVAVLLNDKSNLLDDPTLTVTGASIVSGSGTIKVDKDVVKVSPAEDFVGTLTARYTIIDATNDPNRRVDGTIRVTVKDSPGRPGAPRDGVTGNGTVTFTYTPGPSNGFDITSRRAVAVTASGAEIGATQCKSTTCTVTGLPNGHPYQFKVVETNQAGPSDDSPLSAAYTPDIKPEAPARPVVEFGDKQLKVSWKTPTWADQSNPGSPVDRYEVVLIDAAGNETKKGLPATSTSHTWTGLNNGTRYRFKVRAGNLAGESPFSELSDVEWPAGPPAATGSIVATATENQLGGAFEVTFAASGIDDNGDSITKFVVTPVNEFGDVVDKAVTLSNTGAASQTAKIENLGQRGYKFKVRAENKAGLGAAATTAEWQVAWELPELRNVSSTEGDGSITVVSTSNFADRPEAHPVKEYKLGGGSNWQKLPQDGRITGLTNGKAYDVSVRVRIDGSRASEPVVMPGLMPRTETPRWPAFQPGDFHFKGLNNGLVIVLDVPKDRVESGGWDPDGFRFRCLERCTEGNWTGSNSFNVPTSRIEDGTSIPVAISHRDASDKQTTQYQSLQTPFRATWDRGSRSFNFTLRYVKNASCTLTARSTAADVEDFTKTWKQGGGTSLAPDPIALPEGVAPSSVDLACKADNLQETFRVS